MAQNTISLSSSTKLRVVERILTEAVPENPRVPGSIPGLATIRFFV
jgi:hypothetical protein